MEQVTKVTILAHQGVPIQEILGAKWPTCFTTTWAIKAIVILPAKAVNRDGA